VESGQALKAQVASELQPAAAAAARRATAAASRAEALEAEASRVSAAGASAAALVDALLASRQRLAGRAGAGQAQVAGKRGIVPAVVPLPGWNACSCDCVVLGSAVVALFGGAQLRF
jgi:hypothetical protein